MGEEDFLYSVLCRVKNKLYLCNRQNNICYVFISDIMNNILAVVGNNPCDVAKAIAVKVRSRRLELNLTQEGLAAKAGLKFATYRRFEQTGEISFKGLLQIGFALNALSDFDELFARKQYQTLDDVLNEQSAPRKRGKNYE